MGCFPTKEPDPGPMQYTRLHGTGWRVPGFMAPDAAYLASWRWRLVRVMPLLVHHKPKWHQLLLENWR